jgi:hypothetical protein
MNTEHENLQHHNILPNELYNKLNNEEIIYVKNATYISKWINILSTGEDFDYFMWANNEDLEIMKKLLS